MTLISLPARPDFSFARFTPAEVERIAGVSTALLRDWRRRKIINERLEKGPDGFSLGVLAELFAMRVLSDLGLGPKATGGWTSKMVDHIVSFAVHDAAAWDDADNYKSYVEFESGQPIDVAPGVTSIRPVSAGAKRYCIILPGGVYFADTPEDVVRGQEAVRTVVDLKQIGDAIRLTCGKPIARLDAPTLAWLDS